MQPGGGPGASIIGFWSTPAVSCVRTPVPKGGAEGCTHPPPPNTQHPRHLPPQTTPPPALDERVLPTNTQVEMVVQLMGDEPHV